MKTPHGFALVVSLVLLAACQPMTTETTAPQFASSTPTLTATARPTVPPFPPATLMPTLPSPTRPPTAAPTFSPTPPTTPTVTRAPTTAATLAATILPTRINTLAPTATLALSTPRPTTVGTPTDCISYKDAAQYVGQTTCVTGAVSSATQSGTTYFINFSASRTSFYAVSFTLTATTLPLTKGQCIVVSGKIETFNDRPQIVVRNANQVTAC